MNRRRFRFWLGLLLWATLTYFLAAYLLLPRLWFHREHQPGLASSSALTSTLQGIPGDPLNVGLVGSAGEIVRAMHLAGWFPADAVTLRSGIGIVESVMLDRPYDRAPVSNLLYEGRKQDLAFEKPVGASASSRHHVRFWKILEAGVEGRNVWLGAATLDSGVGLSKYTGQVTHRISPQVDKERNALLADLIQASVITELYQLSGLGPTANGRNGEGDWYVTDGEIRVAVISQDAKTVGGPPGVLAESPLVLLKDGLWAAASDWIMPVIRPN